MVVDEYGEAEFTLHFEHTDLLQPISQHEVPDILNAKDEHVQIHSQPQPRICPVRTRERMRTSFLPS